MSRSRRKADKFERKRDTRRRWLRVRSDDEDVETPEVLGADKEGEGTK